MLKTNGAETHSLPVEVMLFVWSSLDRASIPSLSLVCRTARSWLLPIMYHSIVFTRSSQLAKFLRDHDIPGHPLEARFNLLRYLYVGRTPTDAGDLHYSCSNWPITTVCRLLWLCTSLECLVLLDLDQNKWHRLEYAIPASLGSLTLGPIHGPFHPQDLKKKPQLRHFTSAQTYMRDDEVIDIARYPSLRTFRRISSANSMAPLWSVDQVACVSESQSLRVLEIVVCGEAEITGPAVAISKRKLKETWADPRVVVRSDHRDWIMIIHEDFDTLSVSYLVSQIN